MRIPGFDCEVSAPKTAKGVVSAARALTLAVVLLGSSLSALGGTVFEWSCSGTGCWPDMKTPVTVTVDNTKNPATYQAAGIAVGVDQLFDPRENDEFQFSFDTGTGSFAVLIDITYQNENGQSKAENVQTTSIYNVQTAKTKDGDIEITFDTYYSAKALPADYQKALGWPTAFGDVTIEFDPNADANGNVNDVESADIEIFAAPEPASALLFGSTLLLGGVLGLRIKRAA